MTVVVDVVERSAVLHMTIQTIMKRSILPFVGTKTDLMALVRKRLGREIYNGSELYRLDSSAVAELLEANDPAESGYVAILHRTGEQRVGIIELWNADVYAELTHRQTACDKYAFLAVSPAQPVQPNGEPLALPVDLAPKPAAPEQPSSRGEQYVEIADWDATHLVLYVPRAENNVDVPEFGQILTNTKRRIGYPLSRPCRWRAKQMWVLAYDGAARPFDLDIFMQHMRAEYEAFGYSVRFNPYYVQQRFVAEGELD